jgi:hypothetical protein
MWYGQHGQHGQPGCGIDPTSDQRGGDLKKRTYTHEEVDGVDGDVGDVKRHRSCPAEGAEDGDGKL